MTNPIPCSKPDCTNPELVTPGGRGVVLTEKTAFHRECLLDYATAPLGPLTRRGMGRRWQVGDRCRMGGAA